MCGSVLGQQAICGSNNTSPLYRSCRCSSIYLEKWLFCTWHPHVTFHGRYPFSHFLYNSYAACILFYLTLHCTLILINCERNYASLHFLVNKYKFKMFDVRSIAFVREKESRHIPFLLNIRKYDNLMGEDNEFCTGLDVLQ